jgi:hypothetical protein
MTAYMYLVLCDTLYVVALHGAADQRHDSGNGASYSLAA